MLNRDGIILLAANIIRMLGFGFLSIILAIHLVSIGYDEIHVGIIITAALISSSFFTLLASIYGERIGRKNMLMIFTSLMSISATIFALTTDYSFLLLASLIGFINPTGVNFGAFVSVEQAIIPQTTSEKHRNYVFAIFNMAGQFSMAAGALLAKIPEYMHNVYSNNVGSFQILFILYALLGVLSLILYSILSKGIESKKSARVVLSPETRSIVKRLSALFAIDSFAGGFVIQSWIAYWFFIKFNVEEARIAEIFFIAGILTAVSYLVAVRIASRIGLVRTMVFTHIPANILLIPLAFSPSLEFAIAIYFIRMFLSQMDVPTRQSYVVAIVKPEERVAVAGLTNLARNIPFSTSPTIVGYLFQFISLAFPFITSAILKSVYDLLLYSSFRKIKPPDEN